MKAPVAWAFLFFLLWGCTPPAPQGPPSEAVFQRLSEDEIPDFSDDLDPESLRGAIQRSLTYYGRVPADKTYPMGSAHITVERLRNTLAEFLKLLESGRLDRKTISRVFDVYRAFTPGGDNKPVVTGYYEPLLEGRLEATREFCYPLYGLPPDLLTIDLAMFDSERFSGQRLAGRLKENKVVPYYTRAEIDGQQKLEGTRAELAWLKDPLDAFFVHIQGAGIIRLHDGQERRIGYAGSNGRKYRSIGKALLDRGAMTSDEMSLQAVRSFLRAHSDIRDEVLWQNESYVFFRWVEEGPLGSLNVPLTTGRSIASDPSFHPRGALAFLESKKPRLGASGEVLGWEKLQRWVLNQDAGGAIKGVGRVDLFCGSGEAAEWTAGRLKHPGTLYFLLKRE